jgi:hypothetical protein
MPGVLARLLEFDHEERGWMGMVRRADVDGGGGMGRMGLTGWLDMIALRPFALVQDVPPVLLLVECTLFAITVARGL